MLEKLYIKNYLIIKEAEMSFSEGLNILTGETGAGKSIILDALGLILGNRADYSIIRNEDSRLVVEGYFDFTNNPNIIQFLSEKEIISDSGNRGSVIIRRELTKKGVSRSFINDSLVNISDLKDFGDIIIDIHSQNEHQSLLKKETHCSFLDNFIQGNTLKDKYQKGFLDLKELNSKLKTLLNKRDDIISRKSFLEFQLKEINNVNPLPNEDDELSNELNKMENSEDISISVTNGLSYLYEDDSNVLSGISKVIKELKKASKHDQELEKYISILEEILTSVKNVSDELRDYISTINFDPERIEVIRNRLGALTFLKKKYNLNVSGLINKAAELNEQFNLSENFDYEIDKLNKEIQEKKAVVFAMAEELSAVRIKSGKALEKKVNFYFKEVGLESAEFKVSLNRLLHDGSDDLSFKKGNVTYRLSGTGIDDIEFLIKANKGSEFTPLRKTASGGEVSRIMLSLKASLSGKENIPILVFDEIDAGISGRVAGKVGNVLSELSNTHQIISITHLPQIAAMSDKHFYISKKDVGKETVAEIKDLTEENIITEVARLLSSEKITEASKKTAKELRGFKK
ncbi:MAG: DNA repair protein RecN [Candidatus Kapaibacterium sp.]